uniref:cytochrome-c oxidase n=1 Tax=Apharyngostrigea pipientis TaxID=234879 RepID=A0A8A2H8M3_9TREM|nr:cytochrome c oxidase subunit II [Apharyngostrigea pipientis]QSV37706.1 cytochrome c oxidase subunit II [Apharyngostrigea pipientis]
MLFNASYYDLVFYTYFISLFIPVWIVVMMGLNLYVSRRMVLKVESENYWIEFCWTFTPCVIVFLVCFLNVNNAVETEYIFSIVPNLSIIKAIGHQWYWSYEDVLFGGYYDSMMTDFVGSVDKPLRIVYGNLYKLLVTSADVIHSFAVPDFSVKLDAIPGRIISQLLVPDRCGIFVGYCSELCGAGHAYMPIVVEVISVGS